MAAAAEFADFDNRQRLIDIGPGIFGFDFTDIIPREGRSDDGACTVVAPALARDNVGEVEPEYARAYVDEVLAVVEQPTHAAASAIPLETRARAVLRIAISQKLPDAAHAALVRRHFQLAGNAAREPRVLLAGQTDDGRQTGSGKHRARAGRPVISGCPRVLRGERGRLLRSGEWTGVPRRRLRSAACYSRPCR